MRFESLWIQVYPLVIVLGSFTVFSLFSHFLNSKEIFKGYFCSDILYCWIVFADVSTPFYSTFLGFLVYHWFPPFTVLGTRTNVVSATLVADHFLIFSQFSPFEVSSKKSPVNIPLLGCPKSWLLIFFSQSF